MSTNHHSSIDATEDVSAQSINSRLSDLDAAVDAAALPLTTKGDVLGNDGSDPVRVPVGTSGFILMANSGQTAGLEWVRPMQIAVISDVKATTTDGGSCGAATWNQRDINTESDLYGLVTVSSNQFLPIAGVYLIMATAPAFDCGDNRLRLYNATGAASVFEGQSTSANTTANEQSTAVLMGTFTADGLTTYQIDHYTTSAKTTTGLGQAVGDGGDEVYLTVTLIRLAG